MWDGIGKRTGFFDKNDSSINFGDEVTDSSLTGLIVTQLTVAHWIIDEDKCNCPMKYVEITKKYDE